MFQTIEKLLIQIDHFVWGIPLIALILCGGIMLTIRMGFLQIRKLPLALKWMVASEEDGEGEVSSFQALCTALSATIGT
ncbi:MAG TPA: sodium:alanine symporter family protein, partial [Erysipelotrichaceae bacterium]|nr:sodium:alanine symporter family protein [Erysipelotrichaceae bacterium]